jgi:hypothetical protein
MIRVLILLGMALSAAIIGELLDRIVTDCRVEGGKFHAVCWSANSVGIFGLVIDQSDRFTSITGMAGNPRNLSSNDFTALENVKVQFMVGANDRSWQRSAKQAHQQLQDAGVDSQLEVVPDAPHVMVDLIGAPFMQRLEKLRDK